MPNAKRTRRFSKKSGGRPKSAVPAYNAVIISQTVDYEQYLTADFAHGFGFGPKSLFVNGVSTVNYESDLSGVFDSVRIKKVEMTLLPGSPNLDVISNSASFTPNLPYVYTAIDYTDSTNPSLAEIKQYSTCRVDLANGPIRRTFYPKFPIGSSGVTSNAKQFVISSVEAAQFCGIKVYADLTDQAQTYVHFRASFKVFLEYKTSK